MRLAALLAIISLVAGPCRVVAADSPFKHDWRFERDGTLLISNHSAPPPFSFSGEPEATLEMTAARAPAGRRTLESLVQDEIKEIRRVVVLAEYLDAAGPKPKDGVASWIQTIAGQEVGFIEFRAAGTAATRLPTPQTWVHAIAVKDGSVLSFHLMIRYAGHEKEVRADQVRLIELVIPAFPPRR